LSTIYDIEQNSTDYCVGQAHEWHYYDSRLTWRISNSNDKECKQGSPEQQKPIWFRIGQFLFFVVLAVAFYLLALSMVHHRFFRGGEINQHGVLEP
jgi:hypothetical protein